jgi:cytochrome c biogenesis protein
LKISTILTSLSFNKLLWRIKQQHYSIFQQKNILYCYKGLIGRIAPIVVHFSMILVLLGTIVGALFGFKAQEIVPKTENFHIQNIISNGPLTTIPQTATRVNDLWITYTKTRTISQFYSDVSILDPTGTERLRKTVSVNYPLVYNGVYYYQTDWNLIALRFQNVKQQMIEYPLLNVLNNNDKVWLTWIATNSLLTNGIILIVDNLEGYCSVYNELGQFLGNIEVNEGMEFNQPITLVEIMSSTGLQIKTDPGIPIIYFGFFFLMVSTLISYITYSQVWVVRKNEELFVGGTTNRALFDFELEFLKFIN